MFSPHLKNPGFAPDLPAEIRDSYLLVQVERLQAHVPLLYLAMLLIISSSMIGANPALSIFIRIGLPLVVMAICVGRLALWMHRRAPVTDPAVAARQIARTQIVAAILGPLCSLWCLISWSTAPVETAVYFPLFMAMGSLATAFCLSSMPAAAMFHMAVGLAPIVIAMLLTGDHMAVAGAISIATTATFFVGLLRQQHDKFVELLVLQHRMRVLAETDPLTGLVNRRALSDRFDTCVVEAGSGQGPTLLLIDLDGFKPINDQHGHAAGDEVLREVAVRLSAMAGGDADVARVGGDEFAVLVHPDAVRPPALIAHALLTALVKPIVVGQLRLRIGASLGMAHWPGNGETLEALFDAADRELYADKADAAKIARAQPRQRGAG